MKIKNLIKYIVDNFCIVEIVSGDLKNGFTILFNDSIKMLNWYKNEDNINEYVYITKRQLLNCTIKRITASENSIVIFVKRNKNENIK